MVRHHRRIMVGVVAAFGVTYTVFRCAAQMSCTASPSLRAAALVDTHLWVEGVPLRIYGSIRKTYVGINWFTKASRT